MYIYIIMYIYVYIYAYNRSNLIITPKNIGICDLFFFNCILVIDVLRRVTDIHIFWFNSKRITN